MKKNSSGYYEKRLSYGRDPVTGKLLRKALRAKSIKELDRLVFDFQQEMKLKASVPDNDITFSTYSKRWMETKQGKSINTVAMYKLILDKHIIPEIGDLYFTEIDRQALQDIINKNFSHANTCSKIRLTLRQIYEAAADDGLPNTNINFKRLSLPKQKKVIEKRACTAAEKEAIRIAALPDMEKAFLYVIFYTGLRREEALALRPEDFDFTNNTVSVNKVVVFNGNRTIVNYDMAKNEYSLRSVPLPPQCVDYLKSFTAGKEGFLFKGEGSELPFSRTAYQNFFRRIKKGLEPLAPTAKQLTAHIFRHNYATTLYYSDVSPKMAAKLMGHKDTTMIMKIYAHLDEQKERVTDKLAKAFDF